MGLKIKLNNLDEVETHFHVLYTEQGDGTYILTGVEGMKTQADVDSLNRALTNERADHKVLKAKLDALGDRDINELINQVDRIPELEAAAAGKIDDAKMEQIVESRLRSKLGPLERDLKRAAAELAAEKELSGNLTAKDRKRTIHDEVRRAATKSGMTPEAYEDALLYADNMLEISEDNRIITKDQVGVTPGVDPFVWLTEMQQKKRHWWPNSQSGGSTGSGSTGGFGDNPWSGDNWNLTKQGEIMTQDHRRAEQMAKSAGTSIGGARPASKKQAA